MIRLRAPREQPAQGVICVGDRSLRAVLDRGKAVALVVGVAGAVEGGVAARLCPYRFKQSLGTDDRGAELAAFHSPLAEVGAALDRIDLIGAKVVLIEVESGLGAAAVRVIGVASNAAVRARHSSKRAFGVVCIAGWQGSYRN